MEYLFNLEEDPQEVNNLAGDEEQVLPWRTQLLEILEARKDSAVDDGNLVPTRYKPTPEAELRADGSVWEKTLLIEARSVVAGLR